MALGVHFHMEPGHISRAAQPSVPNQPSAGSAGWANKTLPWPEQPGETQVAHSDTQTVKQIMETQTLLFKVQSSLKKVSHFAQPSLKKVLLRS